MNQDEIRESLRRFIRPGLDDLLARLEFETVERCWCGATLRPWLDEFAAYAICPFCDAKPVRYRPAGASLEFLYGSGYYWTEYQAAHGCPPIERRFESDFADRVGQYLKWVRKLAPPPARTLEVGCGAGRLFTEMSRLGYQTSATEMDARVAAFAGERAGRPVFTGSLPPISEEPFDLILLIDVFEHVADPVRFAADVAARLKPDGKILAHLPIVDSTKEARRSRDMFNPLSHLWIHSTKSLRELWSAQGFRTKRIGELFAMPSWELRRR